MEKRQHLPMTNDSDLTPPSYLESADHYTGEEGDGTLPLHLQLAKSRSYRVNQIVNTYITPLLHTQASSGLSKTTFLLIPSNVSALQQTPSGPTDVIEGEGPAHNSSNVIARQDEIVGFPASEYVKLVRLHGEEHTLEFWRQPSVLTELDASLKVRLANSGHRILEPKPNPPTAPGPTASPTEGKKSSFWSRKNIKSTTTSSASTEDDVTRDMKLGWRADGEGVAALGVGETRVTVGLREVCLRVVTEMGLYETRTGQGVGVSVEVGT